MISGGSHNGHATLSLNAKSYIHNNTVNLTRLQEDGGPHLGECSHECASFSSSLPFCSCQQYIPKYGRLWYSLLYICPATIHGASPVVSWCFIGEIDHIIITAALCQKVFREQELLVKGKRFCGRQCLCYTA